MPKLPWYKRDVDAWRSGTRGMSLELRGFYNELLDEMWDHQGPVPYDVKRIAMATQCHPRKVRQLLPQLIELGKVIETPEGLLNRRMMDEISTSKNRETSSKSRETSSKVPKNQANSTRDLELRTKKKESEAEQKAALPPADDFKNLVDRLIAAAEPCLDNLANCQGLLSIAVPLMWLDQGADIERDVLPTLAAIGKRDQGKRIRSWDYFTRAVAEAKAKRERGLPSVAAAAACGSPFDAAKAARIANFRAIIARKAAGEAVQ